MPAPEPRSLLVIKLADLGDVLTATPALRALRHSFPCSRVDLLTSAIGAEALRHSRLADSVFVADRHLADSPAALANPRSLATTIRLFDQLRRRHYDTVLLLHHLSTPFGALKWRLVVGGLRTPTVAGLDNRRGGFLDRRATDLGFGALHEVEYGLLVAGGVGATTPDTSLELSIPVESRQEAEGLLRSAGVSAGDRPFVCIHPGSGSYSLARRWPAERFAAVSDAMVEMGAKVVLVGGAQDVAVQVIAAMRHHAVDLSGQTGVLDLAALLQRCRLFIGNDSGVMHLATASGCPVVAIFGPSNSKAWGPWRPAELGSAPAVVVTSSAEGCPEGGPCLYRGHRVGRRDGCPERPCLMQITPEQVLDVVRSLHLL